MNNTIRGFIRGVAVVLLTAAVAGCARERQKGEHPDLLLVTVDGNLPMDQTYVTGLSFVKAYTTSPSTLPAAASVLTGLIPPEHGLRVDGVGSLVSGAKNIAEELAGIHSDYRSAAFLASGALGPAHGLTNGFATYRQMIDLRRSSSGLVAAPSNVVDSALGFVGEARKAGKPVFLWVHVSPFTDGRPESASEAVVQIERLFDSFDAEGSVKALVPLWGMETNAPFRGMSVGDDATRVSVALWGLGHAGVVEEIFSVADVKGVLLDAAAGKPQEVGGSQSVYSESVMPWYIFRLAVLQVERGEVETLPPLGLGEVVPEVMANQMEMLVMQAGGHLGEGLIPPYKGAPVGEIGAEGVKLIAKAAEARSMEPREARAEAVSELVKLYPEIPIFRSWLGDILWDSKDYMGACNEYAKVSEYGYNMVGAYRKQSRCHAMIGNIPVAIDTAENAFLLNPYDLVLRRELAQLLLSTGSALMAKKEMKSADECLTRANWLEPKNADAMIQLALLRMATGQTNNAAVLIDEALKVRPGHPVAEKLKRDIGR